MLMLGGVQFTVGSSKFLDKAPGSSATESKVYVKVMPEGLESPTVVALDTGAAWTVFDPEIAEEIGILDGDGEPKTVRLGQDKFSGRLERVSIRVLADEGNSIDVRATVFACRDWPPGLSLLGYNGLLERMRIALDPRSNQFYFGSDAAE